MNLSKNILKLYLRTLASLVLIFKRPKIIGVAGSVNKIFFRQEIFRRLEGAGFKVRQAPKNFNTEIGMPLAILGIDTAYNDRKKWFWLCLNGLSKLFQKNYPEILILEYGTSDPGDMKYLLKIARPDIAIISEITQRYIENFRDIEAIRKEYENFINASRGVVILNKDNSILKNIEKENIITFGSTESSDWRILKIKKEKDGQIVKFKNKPGESQAKINRFGIHHVQAFLAGEMVLEQIKNDPKGS